MSFGLFTECPKWLRYGFLWTVYKKNEWTKVDWTVRVHFLQMIYFEIDNLCYNQNFIFYFSKQTILKLIDHKDCPLDCSLNAQSGRVMVSFGLFIKRMFVFTVYRWSILKLIDHKDCPFECSLDCPKWLPYGFLWKTRIFYV